MLVTELSQMGQRPPCKDNQPSALFDGIAQKGQGVMRRTDNRRAIAFPTGGDTRAESSPPMPLAEGLDDCFTEGEGWIGAEKKPKIRLMNISFVSDDNSWLKERRH